MRVFQKTLALSAVMGCMLGLARVGTAQVVIGDFETAALDGWQAVFGSGAILAQSSLYHSRGNFSLKATGNGYWGVGTPNMLPAHRSDLIHSTQLSMDVWMNNADLNGGTAGFTGFAQQDAMAITLYDSSSNNLFIQVQRQTGILSDSSGQAGTWGGVDGMRHIVWDLTKFTATDPLGGGTKTVAQLLTDHPTLYTSSVIGIAQQIGGGTGTGSMYYDNVQLNAPVPEPASLSVLALGAIALIRRRRK
jgi:hypothetical protein